MAKNRPDPRTINDEPEPAIVEPSLLSMAAKVIGDDGKVTQEYAFDEAAEIGKAPCKLFAVQVSGHPERVHSADNAAEAQAKYFEEQGILSTTHLPKVREITGTHPDDF